MTRPALTTLMVGCLLVAACGKQTPQEPKIAKGTLETTKATEQGSEKGSIKAAKKVEPNAENKKAVAAIEKLGGKVTIDEKDPEAPIIRVDLNSTQTTDADLELLQGLTRLQYLDLGKTKITDAGLAHLKGLTDLISLNLGFNEKITDAGLEHLKGLTKLHSLFVQFTKVTKVGANDLKKTLPTLDIFR